MKTMQDYTCRCTEEQTCRAYKLGAPIEAERYVIDDGCVVVEEDVFAHIPTTQQMINWLEEKKIFVYIIPCFDVSCSWHIATKGYSQYGYASEVKVCNTRKEATIAAIDAALSYLEENGKQF